MLHMHIVVSTRSFHKQRNLVLAVSLRISNTLGVRLIEID